MQAPSAQLPRRAATDRAAAVTITATVAVEEPLGPKKRYGGRATSSSALTPPSSSASTTSHESSATTVVRTARQLAHDLVLSCRRAAPAAAAAAATVASAASDLVEVEAAAGGERCAFPRPNARGGDDAKTTRSTGRAHAVAAAAASRLRCCQLCRCCPERRLLLDRQRGGATAPVVVNLDDAALNWRRAPWRDESAQVVMHLLAARTLLPVLPNGKPAKPRQAAACSAPRRRACHVRQVVAQLKLQPTPARSRAAICSPDQRRR